MSAAPSRDIADDRRARERLCIATRQVRPVGDLIRFVAAPDGTLAPDLRRRLPGRGVWVTASRAAFAEAMRKKAFPRALKNHVTVPADLAATVDGLLERAALDMLSFANKAGLVVPGFAKAEACIASGKAIAILQASDGAPDGARKLAAAAHRTYLNVSPPPVITNFASAHLGLALGRANVIHAALGAGPASAGFLERVAALVFWRDGGLAPAGSAPLPEPPPHAADESSTRDAGPETDPDLTIVD